VGTRGWWQRGAPPVNRGKGKGDLMGGMSEVAMARGHVLDQKLGTEINGQGARGLLGPKHVKEMGRTCQGSNGGL